MVGEGVGPRPDLVEPGPQRLGRPPLVRRVAEQVQRGAGDAEDGRGGVGAARDVDARELRPRGAPHHVLRGHPQPVQLQGDRPGRRQRRQTQGRRRPQSGLLPGVGEGGHHLVRFGHARQQHHVVQAPAGVPGHGAVEAHPVAVDAGPHRDPGERPHVRVGDAREQLAGRQGAQEPFTCRESRRGPREHPDRRVVLGLHEPGGAAGTRQDLGDLPGHRVRCRGPAELYGGAHAEQPAAPDRVQVARGHTVLVDALRAGGEKPVREPAGLGDERVECGGHAVILATAPGRDEGAARSGGPTGNEYRRQKVVYYI